MVRTGGARVLMEKPDLDAFWGELLECQSNLQALLQLIARRVVDVLGDGCVLTTLTEDGGALQPRVVVHADPVVADAMEAVLGGTPVVMGEGIAGTVAKDRRPIVLGDMPPQVIAETTPARFLPFVRDHPMKALMIVPLVAAGELVGTLGAVRTSSDEPYVQADLRTLEALAERAAIAIAAAVAAPRGVGTADFEAIYRHNLDGVLLTTPDGHILAANPAACTILGLSEREIVDRGRAGIVVPADPRLGPALAERAATGRTRSELTLRRGDGMTIVADVSSTIFTTPEGKVRACVIFRDVSDRVAARELADMRMAELAHLADHDDLTGLWNRRGFISAAEQALRSADRRNTPTQVLFLDLDGLKALNDAHGHAAGDAAIAALAGAIRRTVREVDVACRIGGDEFVVLLPDTSAAELPVIVERIQRELEAEPDLPLAVSFSTGTAERLPGSDVTITDLLEAADRGMYQQKVLRRLRDEAAGGDLDRS